MIIVVCAGTTKPLVLPLQGACTGTTRGLYGIYKMLVVRLQKACSRTTNSFEQTPLRQNAVRTKAINHLFLAFNVSRTACKGAIAFANRPLILAC